MSDAPAEKQEVKPEGEQEPKVDVDALVKRMESLESSNQRLLTESKSWKAKYQNVNSEVEKKQTEEMQQANDFKGLWEKSQVDIAELKDIVKDTKRSSLETTLKYEVAKNAKDAEDTDILLAAVKMKKKDLLGYDKETETWKGVDSAIDELRASNPGLFIQDKPGMINGRPKSTIPKEKTVEEQILEDPTAVLNEAITELLK